MQITHLFALLNILHNLHVLAPVTKSESPCHSVTWPDHIFCLIFSNIWIQAHGPMTKFLKKSDHWDLPCKGANPIRFTLSHTHTITDSGPISKVYLDGNQPRFQTEMSNWPNSVVDSWNANSIIGMWIVIAILKIKNDELESELELNLLKKWRFQFVVQIFFWPIIKNSPFRI